MTWTTILCGWWPSLFRERRRTWNCWAIAPVRDVRCPTDLAANDIAATRSVLEVDRIDVPNAERAVALADGSRAVLLADPDGHRLVFREQVDADD